MLTRDSLVHKRSPESEAVVECAARILSTRGLESYTRIDAASACADVRGNKVMEQDSHPLGCGGASAVACGRSSLCDIVRARCNSRRKIRSVSAPIVNQNVLEERGLYVGIVQSGIGSG
jgi:hypothetical protein